jgi:hypothetical protein
MTCDRLVMDIEASGLADESYPISIGVAGAEGQSWSWLVYPLEDWQYWDEFSEDIHGIARSQLLQDGRDGFIICRDMNAIFAGKTLIVDSEWDQFWINRLFSELSVRMAFTVRHMDSVLDQPISRRVNELMEFIDWPHKALDDAKLLLSLIESAEKERL